MRQKVADPKRVKTFRKSKLVLVFNEHFELITIFASARVASTYVKVSPQAISLACRGKLLLPSKKLYFRYIHDSIEVEIMDLQNRMDLLEYDNLCGWKMPYNEDFDANKVKRREKRSKRAK